MDTAAPYDAMNLAGYSLAVSGDVFRWIVDFGPQEVLQRMLVKGQVFARMSPDEKHELVEKLQSIDYCCGFCGDGFCSPNENAMGCNIDCGRVVCGDNICSPGEQMTCSPAT